MKNAGALQAVASACAIVRLSSPHGIRPVKTPRMIESPELTRLLVRERVFDEDPMFVVDVGASGGIDGYWFEFGNQLKAIGFDPLTTEIERLSANAPAEVAYVAAWVTSRSPHVPSDSPDTHFFSRTSAVRAAEIGAFDYAREYFNAGAEMTLATQRIVLDDYFDADDAQQIDFIKIDTDGHDFEVLRGCDRILRTGGVLGVSIEAQFQGAVSEGSGVFSDVDSFLRNRGFSLFDLEVYRYSRAALPAPFVYDIPAQTTTGQVFWGDALYLRDLGHPSYASMWPFSPERVTILKLVCLLEMFGMPDCAAELVLKYDTELGSASKRDELLDVLVGEAHARGVGYRAYMEEFEAKAIASFQRS